LREFIAGNLFDDLLTPEVEVLVPTGTREEAYERGLLPAMRTLRELMPGNVTRHFGVSSFSRRHWVPLALEAGGATVDIVNTYRAQFVGSFTSSRLPTSGVALYRPLAVTLGVPPPHIRDATSMAPLWEVHVEPLGQGREVTLGRDRWKSVLAEIHIHSHGTGDGARYRRFALGASGTLFGGVKPEPVTVTFSADGRSDEVVGLGIESDVDAIRIDVPVPSPSTEPSRLERSDRMTYVLMNHSSLPPELNWFQRSTLGTALLVLLAELDPSPSRDAFDALTDEELASALVDALTRLGLEDPAHPDNVDTGATTSQNAEAVHTDSDRGALESWCRNQFVVAAIRNAGSIVWSSRDAQWVTWWRERFAATVGAVFLEAVSRAAPEVDISDLAIDIDPQGASQSLGVMEVWISELAPGGNGYVEQIHRSLLDDPKRFARLLDRVLEDNEFERLDRDVTRFLELEGTDSKVRSRCEAIRVAWDSGHAAVAKAFADLRSATEIADTEFARTAWTTIVNRLLGPGAHCDLPSKVRQLIARWEAVEAILSLEIPTRVFGALCADDESVDDVLRLGDAVSRNRRSRSVGNFFWPRGGAATRIQLDAGNAFGLLPTVDQEILRHSLGAGARLIDVVNWDEEVEQLTHQALIDEGYLVLRFAAGSGRLARAVNLRMQLEPVDVGALLVYPRVVGLWRRDGSVHLALVLDEAVA
jgi:hypothetical protein